MMPEQLKKKLDLLDKYSKQILWLLDRADGEPRTMIGLVKRAAHLGTALTFADAGLHVFDELERAGVEDDMLLAAAGVWREGRKQIAGELSRTQS